MKTIDILTSQLCEQIDYLKDEVEKYKQLYEEERTENTRVSHERMEAAERGVADALLLALSVEDKGDGSLSISKENRKTLAKRFK